jgi:MFS transporter, ACS family, glucarate transporter
VPGGLIAERIGSRLALTLAEVWWSIMTVLTAFCSNLASFVAVRALLEIGQAADWPASVHSINWWFPRTERARANSILLGGLYLEPIFGTPLTVALIAALGWQWSFYIYGPLGLVMGLLWYAFFRDRPGQHPGISAAEAEHIVAGYDAARMTMTTRARS